MLRLFVVLALVAAAAGVDSSVKHEPRRLRKRPTAQSGLDGATTGPAFPSMQAAFGFARADEHAGRQIEPATIAAAWHMSASGYRPALIRATTRQRIPRRIIQVGKDFASAMSGRNADLIKQWWTLNPDHEYAFFNDSHARRYVMARASPDEVRAYLALIRGAQRADVFRMIWMKYEGGIYTDLDSKALNPLSGTIPPMASAYTGQSWSFEFLAYEPRHPIIKDGLEQMTRKVLGLVEALKTNVTRACEHVKKSSNISQKMCYEKSKACFGAHRCVVSVTGPLGYQAGIGDATHRLECTNRHRTFRNGECSKSTSSAMQRVHVCENFPGFEPRDRPRLTCNLSWHLDCRNGRVKGLKCQGTHYSRVGPSPLNFYSTSPLMEGKPGM